MNQFQVIVLATPFFLVLIALEFAWGYARQRRGTGHNTYRLNDAINSISLGVLSQLGGIFTKLLTVGIYTAIYSSVALFDEPVFWGTWYGVLLALVFYDLCYYWLHRAGHRIAVFWAAHVVHHQSQHYNLSTALRQTSSGALLGWLFYVPMAIAGVPPLIFGIVALIDLLYQFWVHTEQVGKLGWFDRVFCSPSNHRVHHAVNDHYLDRNYGGILVLWDRLFGTFREEDKKCVYGTRGQLDSWDPLWANAEVYWALFKDSWHTRRWSDKLRVWLKPPGWRPSDVAARFPKADFDMAKVSTFDPPASRATLWFAGVQFALLLLGVSTVLWFAESWPTRDIAVWSAALAAGYWAIGAVLQGRISVLEVLLIEVAALATATSTLGLLELHFIFKPLTMLVAIVFVAMRAMESGAGGRFDALLMAALAASLAGDVFLMLPGGYFIPGLASFLVGHLFYIALFHRGMPWFPSRRALLGTLGVGAAMYAWVWGGLNDPVLKVAVAAYVTVIALMTAQAIGRAQVQRDPASTAVAVGACFFMLSDSLIAINRFVQPVPLVALWVLSTYYMAQILIVHNARSVRPSTEPLQSSPMPYGG
ncbi:MAG: lysoplasmalogenase family protein [Rhodoferax sp.]|uniref:lysoplasmalogenase family protein n=1 Tax=Rhodoferax sp. TaxID=50421 RepID=UPI0027215ADC|nr:lysoplasmalogenase family protein [Rhodoferax sp.]MDO8449912.1 lysoplasmalogenase family protein [Rhodoferax sp.]